MRSLWLSTAQRTASVSFTFLLVRCMGKRLGASFLKIAIFVRFLYTIGMFLLEEEGFLSESK
ncbi:hypothetical protein CIPAW_10G108300 [Carya illinoinensis]|uniref:Uncharacterized protein n=1 Tax=Carya illinoinensis TaxID=32201 RepID=A0A8T1PD46_CARIL|nr:hypothetical protein CIPAW_10G108300 [Carya illinoinensis]